MTLFPDLMPEPAPPVVDPYSTLDVVSHLQAHALVVMQDWHVVPRVENDTLKIIAHAFEGADDYPPGLRSGSAELPEVYVRMHMPAHVPGESREAWGARLQPWWDCETMPDGKWRPRKYEYFMTLLHPTDRERQDSSTFTARWDGAVWSVTREATPTEPQP